MGPLSFRTPVIGHWYCVLCPVCGNTVSFQCQSTSEYGISCYLCQTLIDLRNPCAPLEHGDSGVLPPQGGDGCGVEVRYSPKVGESNGASASSQLFELFSRAADETQKLSSVTGHEATELLSARRVQALSDKFWILHPLVHAVEYVVFGNKPVARVGNVRIFRLWFPLIGDMYVPVVETSKSYALPTAITFSIFCAMLYLCAALDNPWFRQRVVICAFCVVSFIVLIWASVYTDPGYVRPAYLADELTACGVEEPTQQEGGVPGANESQWEMVNGVRVERRWCGTCKLYRPLRAKHCYFCGMCVEEMDHHCGVIGVCVGRRNILTFLLLVATAVVSSAIAFHTLFAVLYTCLEGGHMSNASIAASCGSLSFWHYFTACFSLLVTLIVGCSCAMLGISILYTWMRGLTHKRECETSTDLVEVRLTKALCGTRVISKQLAY
ncbi:putative DHHC palmitoyltransferase [Trypanosoma vivax]|nr:putative DHHC palmitoyltransferase [Trypanosoma vivax]